MIDAPPMAPLPDDAVALPFSEEAEEAVLSALVVDSSPTLRAEVRQVISASHFYQPAHRRIFDALQDPSCVDVLMLAATLEREGTLASCGGKEYLGYLIDRVPTSANAVHHARIVRECADRRRVIQSAEQAIREASQGSRSAREIVQGVTSDLLPVAADVSRGGFRPLKDLLWETMEELERRAKARRDGSSPGLTTGLSALDARLGGGFHRGELVLIVAVPGHGKTALALNIAVNAARSGHAGAFVSAEMDRIALVERVLNNAASVDGTHTRSGDLRDTDFARLAQAMGTLPRLPLWVDDTALPTLEDITAKCRALKAKEPALSLVFVDFIQLVQSDYRGRQEMETVLLERIAYGLKGLAKDLGLVVIATCQPNDKEIEDRQEKGPQLRDLARSAGFRRAADFIALCHRPKLYSPTTILDTLEVNMAKTRQGVAPFTASLAWEGRYMRVSDRHTPDDFRGPRP